MSETVHEIAARELTKELGAKNIHISPGTDPNVTVEQVKAEVRRAIKQMEDGDMEILE